MPHHPSQRPPFFHGNAFVGSNPAAMPVASQPQGYNYAYSSYGGYMPPQIGGGQQYPASAFNAQPSFNNHQQIGGPYLQPTTASGANQFYGGYGYTNGVPNQSSQSNIGFGNNFTANTGTGTEGQQAANGEPGYLPNYRGDQYTNPQRIEETRALNAPFYQGIGGEPNYGQGANGGRGYGYPPQNGIN